MKLFILKTFQSFDYVNTSVRVYYTTYTEGVSKEFLSKIIEHLVSCLIKLKWCVS